MDNRAGEMDVFVASLEHGSFSAAGRRLGLTPSAVAKLLTRIEQRLGTRLLMRSTRKLKATPEGELYLARARQILADIDDAERAVANGASAAPRGRLKVTSSAGFGESLLLPLVPSFLDRYPQVDLDLSIHDRVVDLFDERADVALRAGPLADSSLNARKIVEAGRVVVAAPAYLARHGTPAHPSELERHNCLGFNFRRSVAGWPFRDPATGREWEMAVSGNALLDAGPALRRLCASGLGIARVGRLYVQREIEEGRLVPILEAFNPGEMETVHALFVRHEHMAARIRAFVDFLAASLRPDGPVPGAGV
ncbi:MULTISPECIES: LysR family transcriptional regulator [unclassified Aureimonas]|uniref:LysR family transcriptional regulator n=1 Tax=unclassified Aureimonas TaxID=2615206 RepID=UPI0006F4A3FA|nr:MULTISPECIES: LysR family transcriptional regulator [unclassified Aureimonas]KQT68943.1 LysR family transcriptional regulator [Aureimonas sp. Leaf460]KQT69170.1 LysR family transcriptional regulator [Aureimonas sp. Leaf427]